MHLKISTLWFLLNLGDLWKRAKKETKDTQNMNTIIQDTIAKTEARFTKNLKIILQ